MVRTAGGKSEKTNVRVIARCRPVNAKESKEGGHTVVKFFPENPGSVELTIDDAPQTFQFDRMFSPESTQEEVFEDSVFPLIQDVLSGYNATVFAYGQTGTGKTHTMEGNIHVPGQEGIIPRSVAALFGGVAQADETVEFTFKVSYVEIYMEKIRDLLDPHRMKNNLTIREDKANGIYIAGVTEEYVTSVEELLQCMQSGAFNRATAATGMNEGSSRSHSVFTITVGQKDQTSSTKSGKLVLVDLAGSEMVRKTGASGQQLEEAKTINKSLSALGQVINALTDEKQTHIPYRDSKLTRVLQDSLGGNSKTVLIVAISPSSYNANETLSTIRFGLRAKAIENKITVNASRSVEELEALLARAEKAIDVQNAHIVTLTAKLEDALQGIVSEDGLSSPGGVVFDSNGKPSPGRAATAEQVAIMEKLQTEVATLTQDLDDERHDSARKDTELNNLSLVLQDKERLLSEAGELLQEARKHYESQRERCELLVREKAELGAQMSRLSESMSEELDQSRFALKEAQISMATLRTENKNILAELADVSGDQVPARDRASLPNATTTRDPVPPRRQASSSQAKSESEREAMLTEAVKAFHALCSQLGIPTAASTTLREHFVQRYHQQEEVVLAHETRVAALEKAHQDASRRVRELDLQRERLETDLLTRTESAVRTKLELETLMSRNVGSITSAAGSKPVSPQTVEEFGVLQAAYDKVVSHNKSLQQRLEQLVAVHRQLLRKFASQDLDASELRKLMTLRDERIYQLECNAKNSTNNLRAQGERHVAELTNLREQIRLMKEEHVQRSDQHYMDLQLLVGRDNSSGSRRTVRGGHANASETSSNSLLSGIKAAPPARSSFSRTILGGKASALKNFLGGVASAGASAIGVTPEKDRSKEPNTSPSTMSSSFHAMMSRLGVR